MHAQVMFRNAFNSAWKVYRSKKDRHGDETHEEVSFRAAWSAVRHDYGKFDGKRDWAKKK